MAKKTANKIDKNDPEVRKRHLTYLFWAAVVIAVSLLQMATKNSVVTVLQFGVSVLALFMLLRLDGRFMRVHKAFRSASSIKTAQIKAKDVQPAVATVNDQNFNNRNLNKKHSNHDMVKD